MPLCFSVPSSPASKRLESFCDGFRFGLLPDIIDPTDHHFFPSLVTPADLLLGIGIRCVGRRIIEVRKAMNLRPLGEQSWLRQPVGRLPAEIVARNRKEDLGPAVWVFGAVLKIPASQMHVRHEGQ